MTGSKNTLTERGTGTKPKARYRTVRIALISIVALLIVGRFVIVPMWLPTAIVYAPNFGMTIQAGADPDQLARLGVSRQLRVSVGPRAASLSVWIMDPANGSSPQGTILVLHGIRDKKDSMHGTGHMLAAAGYRRALVDLRGHGRSTGDWLSYGVVESRDLSQVLDALTAQSLLVGPIGALGCSYGGAVALQLTARDPRVRQS